MRRSVCWRATGPRIPRTHPHSSPDGRLSGTDGGDFTINEQGELRFRNIPDYERPADSGRDNVYSLSVRASDGSLYGYLPVTVTVTDVNEPPDNHYGQQFSDDAEAGREQDLASLQLQGHGS